MSSESNLKSGKIKIKIDGPYKVDHGIPLVSKTQIVTEYGEPIAWKKDADIPVEDEYSLCRCGESREKPFCDGTHCENGFDGTESADTGLTTERQIEIEEGTNIFVRRDNSLCMSSGFCGNRFRTVDDMVPDTEDVEIRSNVIAMIERCPSGSYVYRTAQSEPDIEPDLPIQIAVTTEITADGPIEGPLWVTGYIPIERSDGKPMEIRNRVTLCSCGKSDNKPLCDGAHRYPENRRPV